MGITTKGGVTYIEHFDHIALKEMLNKPALTAGGQLLILTDYAVSRDGDKIILDKYDVSFIHQDFEQSVQYRFDYAVRDYPPEVLLKCRTRFREVEEHLNKFGYEIKKK